MDLKAGLGLAIIATSSPGALAAKGGLHVHPSQVVAGLLIATVLLLGLVILFGPRDKTEPDKTPRDKTPRDKVAQANQERANAGSVAAVHEREPLNRA